MTEKMLSMVAQIALGMKKADSHLVTDAETAREWDELSASHEELKKNHPGAYVEIPNDPEF